MTPIIRNLPKSIIGINLYVFKLKIIEVRIGQQDICRNVSLNWGKKTKFENSRSWFSSKPDYP